MNRRHLHAHCVIQLFYSCGNERRAMVLEERGECEVTGRVRVSLAHILDYNASSKPQNGLLEKYAKLTISSL